MRRDSATAEARELEGTTIWDDNCNNLKYMNDSYQQHLLTQANFRRTAKSNKEMT